MSDGQFLHFPSWNLIAIIFLSKFTFIFIHLLLNEGTWYVKLQIETLIYVTVPEFMSIIW